MRRTPRPAATATGPVRDAAPPRRSSRWDGAASGLAAAALALGSAQVVAAGIGPESAPLVVVGGVVIDATPTPLKELAVATFGTNDKPILLGGILLVLASLAALAGSRAVRNPAVGDATVAMLGIVGAAAALTRPTGRLLDALPSLAGAFLGAVALRWLLRERGGPAGAVGEAGRPSRRTLLWATGATVLAVAAGGLGRVLASSGDVLARRAGLRLPAPVGGPARLPEGLEDQVPGLTPFVTANEDFYRVDTALVVPRIDVDRWRLRVHGMVRRELDLTFDDLLSRPLLERVITLTCVSNEVGGPYVGNARWLGAALAPLIREAGPSPEADQLLSRSVDGMSIGTPMRDVMDGRDALLAVGMNGEPLPLQHGYPVRMVVPGLYGYVSATKWLVDLEVTRFDAYDAYWVSRDWARMAPIKTSARIDTPKPLARITAGSVVVAGVAWAQHRGIEEVQVRVDGGQWRQTELFSAPL